MRARWDKYLQAGQANPIVLEMLGPIKNQRTVGKALFGQDVEIPGEKARNKVLGDLSRLMLGAPVEQPDPITGAPVMIPSVLPDKDVDDLALDVQVAKEFLTEHYWELKEQPPAPGVMPFENIVAYLRLAAQFEAEKQIAAAPPPEPGAPPGGPPGPPKQ